MRGSAPALGELVRAGEALTRARVGPCLQLDLNAIVLLLTWFGHCRVNDIVVYLPGIIHCHL